MRRYPAAVIVLLVLAGCGAPGSLAKQAEEVASIAAEGAILAHDASEGDTTSPFTGVHARALRQKLDEVREVIENRRLSALAAEVATQLERLESEPADEAGAAAVERRLERLAEAADEIEMSA